MKKISLILLATALIISLCACRFGGDSNPTQNTPTTQPTNPATMPDITDPPFTMPQIDPTIDTNIPDTNVDDDHMTDTNGNGSDDGISSGGDSATNNNGNAINRNRIMK